MQPSPWDPEGVEVVLDPEGNAESDLASGLDLKQLYRTLVTARLFDHRVGRMGIPMWASAAGEEAPLVACGLLMREGDWVYGGARDLTVAIARGVALDDLVEQLTGADQAGGRRVPGTVASAAHGVAPATDGLGLHLALAAGHAHGQKLTREGSITVAICGEGTTTTGMFHETVALAVSCDLPLCIVNKSQLWPEGAPAEAGLLGESVAERARACGLWSRRVDGADVLAVYGALTEAMQRARDRRGPTLVDVVVAQAVHNPPPHRDPIERLRRHLDNANVWSQTFQDVIEAEVLGHLDRLQAEPGDTA